MGNSIQARRIAGLLVLAAALLMLAAALGAPEADAKQKKKKINVVRCAEVGFECVGTNREDRLVGTPGAENIFGKEGNDIYVANGGNSILIDESTRSSDFYTAVDPGEGRNTIIFDSGGKTDFLDMGSFRATDFTFIKLGDELVLVGPELRTVRVENHFGKGRIEKIKFADKTLKASQIEGQAREATPEERTAIEEHPDEEQLGEGPPEEEFASQDKDSPEKGSARWATPQDQAATKQPTTTLKKE